MGCLSATRMWSRSPSPATPRRPCLDQGTRSSVPAPPKLLLARPGYMLCRYAERPDTSVSGAAVIKPKLIEALTYARSGDDTLVVWKLERLSRSTRDLIET